MTPIQMLPLPVLDATQFLDQMRDMQARVAEIYGIPPSLISGKVSESEKGRHLSDRMRFETSYQWTRSTAPLGTMHLIEKESLTVPAEDWSRVRSPSRARRRMKRGHQQNIRYYQKPDPNLIVTGDKIIGHPETLRAAMRHIRERVDAHIVQSMDDALRGRL